MGMAMNGMNGMGMQQGGGFQQGAMGMQGQGMAAMGGMGGAMMGQNFQQQPGMGGMMNNGASWAHFVTPLYF